MPRWAIGARAGALALGLIGCLMEIPDLIEDPIGSGGSAGIGGGAGLATNGGTDGGGSGASLGGTGGAGGADEPPPCPIGQKQCNDGECRPIAVEFGCGSAECTPCASVARAVIGCTEGIDSQCFVEECDSGFADCDGDVIADRGAIAGNGCEFQFAPVSPSPDTMPVPFRPNITLDGQVGDWESLPAYAFETVCPDCRDDVTKDITEDGTFPARNDLEGYFRVAWNDDFLFVLGEVFDPNVLDDGAQVANCGMEPALCEDGLQVFVDGQQQLREGYFNDNIRVLFGASDRVVAPSQGDRHEGFVSVKTGRQFGPACYAMEARLDWRYLTNQASGAPLPAGVFPPANGQQYGFDVSISDWDPSLSDENVFERQSAVFWADPGSEYGHTTAGLPLMVLEGRPGPGPE